ncbi:MAG: S26 family signal peptidase [Planctomycetes bacterium]|nr:S26 family signal peptidase [Planctomycetota bacterium]
MKKSVFIRTAWALAALLLALVLARSFVGNVYHVRSGSMEPTILGLEDGGEWVFVRYDRAPPKRNELVVVLPVDGGDPIVKRVLGLPYERVQVLHGDVWIDGRVLRRSAEDGVPRPFVTEFDERLQPFDASFHMGSTAANPWTRADGAWRVDATGIPAGSDEGLAYLVPKLDDGYFGPDHARVKGETDTNDLALECEVFCESARGRVRFQLTERGDTFEFSIAPTANGDALGLLTRRNQGDRLERLASVLLPRFTCGAWHKIRVSNVDDELALELDGAATPLRAAYERNELHPADRLFAGTSPGARVLLGAEGVAARFRGVRIERDLVFTPLGEHGTATEAELGADQYFLLGDNSAHSSDSRTFGPVPLARIVGRATHVVWPPSRWRRLDAPRDGRP